MQQSADRQFYSIDSNTNKSHFQIPSHADKESIVKYVGENVIGGDKVFAGPFGLRKVVYLDYIASGRALSFIEDYIHQEVLPEYGNTHTTTSVTSLQTTMFRHEARDIIRNAVNASEYDSVIFTGSGSTSAIHKLIHALDLKQPPVVLVGPFEHHSNLLPWKDKGAEVVRIKQTCQGLVDTSHLEQQLQVWSGSGRQLIGSFSAASNVTGIMCDVTAISVLLHRHGALAFWDYATAAPYVKLDMNPVIPGKDAEFAYKDAMFISPHKFVGGVSTPGVLVMKKRLFCNAVPEECGGGTVFYVRREAHRYLREPELKEEGGTPDIVGAIRAGLVFQLKSAISPEVIMQKENDLFSRAASAWGGVPQLVILGGLEAERLPVFSFLVHHPPSGLFLHHNYVSALLNDLFGIQARGGCACAGPYAMDLLGLAEDKATEIEELLAEDGRLDRVHLRRYMEYSHREILRPGFTRLNLPYFISEDQLDFVLQAVTMVAEHGWKLLPQYMFNPETGEWRHKDHQVFKERKWLGHISFAGGHMQYSQPKINPKAPLPASFTDCLDTAKQLFGKAGKTRTKMADHTLMFDEDASPYRWFLLPSEAGQVLHGDAALVPRSPSTLPFCPPALTDRLDTPHLMAEEGGKRGPRRTEASQTLYPEGDQRSLSEGHGDPACRTEASQKQDTGHGVSSCDAGSSCHKHDIGVRLSQLKLSPENDSGTVEQGERQAASCDNFPQALQAAMEHGYCDRAVDSSVTESQVCDTVTENQHLLQGHDQGPALAPVSSKTFDKDSGQGGSSVLIRGTPWVTEGAGSSPAALPTASRLLDKQSVSGIASGTDRTEQAATTVSELISGDGKSASASETEIKKKAKKKKKKKNAGNSGGSVENGQKRDQTRERKREEKSGCQWVAPSKDIFTPSVKALEDYSMLRDGDRVLVCLSGGKDSLSLLHTMHQFQFYCRSKGISFELGAVTVDPQTPSYDPSPLKDYLAAMGVPYFYESQCIMDTAMNLPYECASICSFCSRMKRGRIYAAARREGYNVLALGQHLDDLAESFIMSLFHNGSLRTMKAHYTVQQGDLRVIRPFVYVREKDLRDFASKNKLPVISENCPACFEAPKERHRTKQLLASQEILFPNLYSSILSAIKPVMAVSRAGSLSSGLLSAADAADDLDI